MYKGFNLNIDENSFVKYLDVGNESHADTKREVEESLDSFKGKSGKLTASKITASWFPPIDADIFISHSHNDADLAIRFSGWLKKEFDLTSFIDSCVWGYSETLQKMIDNEYSRSDSNSSNYIYENTVRSATHVNMMLSVALTKMIDRCECVFFLNTPESIPSKSYIDGTATESPWIYSEIAMTSLIRRRSRSNHRNVTASVEKLHESFQMLHEVNLDHLTDINSNDLHKWLKLCDFNGVSALDKLYSMTT